MEDWYKEILEKYLSKPYHRVFVHDPQEKEYPFFACILEFPGCWADGKTLEDTYSKLESVTVSWIDACLDMGQMIPEPIENIWKQCNIV